MCRLFAYACEGVTAASDVFGEETYLRFRALARLHRDGWGIAWLSGSDTESATSSPRAARSLVPAFEDPHFDELARSPLGKAGMVHLRWATAGLEVTAANTHPFVADGWSFAHQGSIPRPELIEELLSPPWSGKLGGKTDSERYFLYLLQCAAEAGDVVAGAQRAVGDIVQRCGPTSLNALLLSDNRLVVVHGTAGLEPSVEDMLEVVGTEDRLPPEHREAYYRLRYRRRDGGVAVVSSGLGAGDGWNDLPDECIVDITLSDDSMEIYPFR